MFHGQIVIVLFRIFTVRDNARCSACACVSSPPCVASDSGKMDVFSKSTYILLYIEDSTPLFTGIVQANPCLLLAPRIRRWHIELVGFFGCYP